MKLSTRHSVVALVIAGAFGVANATPLNTNVLTSNVDTTGGFMGGTLLESAITLVSNSAYNGTARAAVYDTGSGLDFYFQFTNNASSVNGIERFGLYDFSSLGTAVVDVFQTSAAFDIFVNGTETADYADRSSLGVIGISFVPNGLSKILPGTTSFTQIVRTNARFYEAGNFGLLDGIGDNAAGFAPAVPEPETYAMFLAGLGLMGAIARRRRPS